MKPDRSRWLVPLAIAACSGVLTYSIAQMIQFSYFPPPDPRVAAGGGRIAFFWRSWLALYVACGVGVGAAGLRARVGPALDRHLTALVVCAAVVAVVQASWFP